MSRLDPEVDQELRQFCAQALRWRARAVLLFGSRAKGEHTEESDADVCLIAEDLPADLWQRRYPAPTGYRFLSVVGFHPGEFLRLLQQGNPLLLDIMHDGITLYDDGFIRQAQGTCQKTVQRLQLRRTRQGWNWGRPRAHPHPEPSRQP